VSFLGTGILLILVAGALPLVFRQYPTQSDAAFRILILGGVALAAVPAVQVLLGASVPPVVFQTTLPGGPWAAGVDSLSAWFVLLLCVVTAATACFGVTYLAGERSHGNVASSHALFSLLVAAMLGVFTGRAVMPFLLTWELMAVSAYFLMLFDHRRAEVRRAGMVYLIVTHAGTLVLVGMFLLWGRSGQDLSFANLTPGAARVVAGGAPILLLALVGFGAKAGIFPLHFWLPGAHAAAPSHVSALLSGVMIKTGIYGLLRVLILFGPLPKWWGWTLLLLGLTSALFGVRWALSQHDLKRALAYSSVDNIGIILLGLGLGSLGSAYQRPALLLLGFAGALLHAMNHALFKSLLFLGAGAVGHATGTRQIDRLGGLVRSMPRTAWAFLLGSVAIIGLPGLNGFVGEWTLVRGFLAAGGTAGSIRFAGLGVAAVGLIGALTLACFLRLGSTVFLGVPRVPGVAAAADAPGGIGFGMALLGVLCLGVGLFPSVAAVPAGRVAAMLMPGLIPGEIAAAVTGAPTRAITVLVLSLLLVGGVVWAIRRSGSPGVPPRIGATWGCAFPAPSGRMQYTAASFSAPLARMLDASGAVSTGSGMPVSDSDRDDRLLRGIVVPVWERIKTMAGRLRPIQDGRVTTYLQFIVGTVLVLLAFLFFAGMGTPP
jgi:hydrogenase-4 component B